MISLKKEKSVCRWIEVRSAQMWFVRIREMQRVVDQCMARYFMQKNANPPSICLRTVLRSLMVRHRKMLRNRARCDTDAEDCR